MEKKLLADTDLFSSYTIYRMNIEYENTAFWTTSWLNEKVLCPS